MRKYGYPLFLIIALALSQKLLFDFQKDAVGHFLYLTINGGLLFSLGLSLNNYKKSRNQTWVKKLIVVLVVVFFFLYQLDLIVVMSQIKVFFNFIGLNEFIIQMIYIYCGWVFFS